MKNIMLISLLFLIFSSCSFHEDWVEVVIDWDSHNNGEPSYIHFKTENEGYVFSYTGGMYAKSVSYILKTTNGGKRWKKVFSLNDYYFEGSSVLFNNSVFGYITNAKDLSKNQLFKFDLTTLKFKMLDFNIEAAGNVWVRKDSIYAGYYNTPNGYVMSVDTNLLSFSPYIIDYTPRGNGISADSTHNYFITYTDQFVVEKNRICQVYRIKNPCGITKISENKLLIATHEQEDAIYLYEYNAITGKRKKIHTFEDYSCIEYMQTNEKMIIGLLRQQYDYDYDIIYSTDKAKTWHKKCIHNIFPAEVNCLVGNIVYIYSLGNIYKITL